MTAGIVPNTSNSEILIIEDTASSLRMLSELLKSAGYEVRPAIDGELGLRSVQAKKPDLILLDFKLPGMDGVEVCRHLKASPETYDIPVIFISALGDSELKVKALDAGAVDYVTKPIESSEVLARIKTHLNLHYLQKSHEHQAEELRKHRDYLEELVEERTEKLRASEALFRNIVTHSTPVIFMIDNEGKILLSEGKMLSSLGVNPGQNVGKSVFDLYRDIPIAMEGIKMALAGNVFEGVIEIGDLSFEAFYSPNLDSMQNVVGVIGMGVDITDRKKAEEERNNILKLSADLICTVNTEGFFKYLNPAWEKELGYSREELMARPYLDFVHPDDRKKSIRESESLVDGIDIINFENRYICKDGSIITLSWAISSMAEKNLAYCIGRNITDHKKAEEALRESERKGRAYLENSPICTKIVDLDLNLQYMSRAGIEGLGIDDITPYYGKPYPFDFYPESFSVLMTTNLLKAKDTGETITQEAPVVDLDGSELWFHSTIVPVCDDAGRVDYLLVISVDTTERKRAEKERERSRHFLQTVIDGIPESVMVINRDHTIALSNQSVRKMTEKRDPAGDNLKCHQISHGRETPCNGNEHPCPLKQVVESKKAVTLEHIHQDAKGQEYILELIAAPIFGKDGEVIQIIESARDITERRQAEEERNRILRLSSDLICIASPDGYFKFLNPAWEHTLGYSIEELLTRPFLDFIHPEDHEKNSNEVASLCEGKKETLNFENRYICNDGRILTFSWRATYLPENSVMYCIGRDITERKKAEHKIAASLEEKEVLLREIHHRVKNNMQVIVSLLRLHARKTDNEHIRSVLNDCRGRVNAMSLIHEALYQSEDLAGIDSEPYLKKLCRNLSQVHSAASKGIAVTLGKEDVILGMDQGVAIGMIVCELVSNIFKHAFPKGASGSILISLSTIGDEKIELIVQDDGVGLPLEIDIHNSPSLGLHLADIITTHELGGSIEVERSGGTKFIIRFKRKGK